MGKRNKRARSLLKRMSISGEIPSLEVARRFGIEKHVQAVHDEKAVEQARLEAEAEAKKKAEEAKAKAEQEAAEAKRKAEEAKKKAAEAKAEEEAPKPKRRKRSKSEEE